MSESFEYFWDIICHRRACMPKFIVTVESQAAVVRPFVFNSASEVGSNIIAEMFIICVRPMFDVKVIYAKEKLSTKFVVLSHASSTINWRVSTRLKTVLRC